jgi:orotidine-5'-phosphate decarboxylase
MSMQAQTNARQLAREKLIVALDVSSTKEATNLVSRLRGRVGMFKVGFQLFTSAGPQVVRDIVSAGEKVFLDLKFHDIPNTVAAAGVEATRLGVSIFNLHATGGKEMMSLTREQVSREAEMTGITRPAIIAVTVLTSVDATTLGQTGLASTPEEQVRRLTLLTRESGLDGVLASPLEIELIRSLVPEKGFLVVTPGIRSGSNRHDQRRVGTPRQAITTGADYLVVGRPIIGATDPAQATEELIEEMLGLPERPI